MRTEKERNLLLKALDAFKRKIVIISKDFRVLASAGVDIPLSGSPPSGNCCYQAFFNHPKPCDSCPALTAMLTGQPALRDLSSNALDNTDRTCLYAYPITDDDGQEALAIFNFELPALDDLEEEFIHIRKKLEKTRLQLIQSEKMASLGKLSAGVAHQLNNPLGGIMLYTKLMLEEYELQDNAREDLYRILNDAQRCREIVKELLAFARQTRQHMQPLNINKAIDQALLPIENQSLFQNIAFKKKMSTFLPLVMADTQQLGHVFMNIIINAAQAMEGQGTITIATRESAARDRVIIEIADTGPGIPPEVLEHIFEPFFTTKQEGQGTGLGLSVVYGIVENHGGTISARSIPGRGTTFTIELPITHATERGAEHAAHA